MNGRSHRWWPSQWEDEEEQLSPDDLGEEIVERLVLYGVRLTRAR